MRQLRDMSIMEIDITNVCHRTCSNCTRFCGHHQKTFFMDFPTFKRAVDSLDGYQGLISTIGGEPLLHPEYNRFAKYLRDVRKETYTEMNDGKNKAILSNYLAAAKSQRWFQGAMNKGEGYLLFTSMPQNYYSRYEAVEDTVTDLWLNDHTNPSFHQPILVSRKDLGIGDEEFEKLRDNCWLQNFWSGSITPKGCFFCEIAGTLDMLFGGPGGKPIEPGWWQRDIEEFRDQFHWCDICGMALTTYSRNSNDEIDDASPTLMRKLEAISSPKLKRNQVAAFDLSNRGKDSASIGKDMGSVAANYLPENEKRVGGAADYLKPSSICLGVSIFSVDDLTGSIEAIQSNANQTDCICIVTTLEMEDRVRNALRSACVDNARIVVVDEHSRSLGCVADSLLKSLGDREWLVLVSGGYKLPADFSSRIRKFFLNPGYLFALDHSCSAIMFSPIASSIKISGEDALLRCTSLGQIYLLWGKKTCVLSENFEEEADYNIGFFCREIKKNYLSDMEFKERLQGLLRNHSTESGSILLLQSAFVYHTIGIYYILREMGYQIYLLSSVKFKEYLETVAEPDHVYYFQEGAFEYDRQEAIRERIKRDVSFQGAIVPFSFGASTVKPIDDYTRVLRTAEMTGGKILGIINIRRQFIVPEYDIWEEGV